MEKLIEPLKQYVTSNNILTYYSTENKTYHGFWQSVLTARNFIAKQKQDCWCLWEEDSYLFLTAFFAFLLADKTVIFPNNKLNQTINYFAQQNISFFDVNYLPPITVTDSFENELSNLDWFLLLEKEFILYTSGTTAEPKKINRKLKQLFSEITFISRLGRVTSNSTMLATVTHQHIFGLLYKLLLPLFNGASFVCEMILFPDQLLQQKRIFNQLAKDPIIITSPAFLKRIDIDLAIKKEIIFSAGGKLAAAIKEQYHGNIIDIYGSTETGGIAYSKNGDLFTLFDKVSIKTDSDKKITVQSPYAQNHSWYQPGDIIQWLNDDSKQFLLQGRSNRLIKLQGKRFSLPEIEKIILSQAEIKDVFVFLTENTTQREQLNVICVLEKNALQKLKNIGKVAFLTELKHKLLNHLEVLAIPKKWRFVDQIPKNNLDKVDKAAIDKLFLTPLMLPLIRLLNQYKVTVSLTLFFNQELLPFKGHFPNRPIFPGVAQLYLVIELAKQYLAIEQPIIGMEQIKYSKTIEPYDTVLLNLEWENNKLFFRMEDMETNLVSSGRIVYRAP